VVRAHPRYTRKVQDAGSRVFVWTVDEPADVTMACEIGVDAIITNRPREVRGVVDGLTRVDL
jgi:glycerophosphoryl diester phosphodiesterase